MKKQILIIGPSMEIGGIETSLIGLLDSFDYSKYAVDLLLMAHTGELMPFINKNANLIPEEKLFCLNMLPIKDLLISGHWFVAMIRLISKLGGKIRSLLTHKGNVYGFLCRKILSKYIRPINKDYDIVLGFIGPFFFHKDKIRATIKINWVHTDFTSVYENYDANFYRDMWRGLDYIACVSESVRCSFNKVYPEFANKTVVVENMLSKDFVLSRAEQFNVDNEMINDGSYKILSVGRFSIAKNYDGAIEACKLLNEKGLNVKWYFIGYGPEEPKLKKLINQLGIDNKAIILGKRENPYPYIKACDLYVQPSRYEGKSVTVREAQMLGKPVLITRYATSSSQLEEGVDGHICDLTLNGIVDGVEFMIQHPEYADELSRNCNKRDYSNCIKFDIDDWLCTDSLPQKTWSQNKDDKCYKKK